MPITYDLSPADAADLLGVHEETVKRWARADRIPAWRTPGGWWRFSRSELEEWRSSQGAAGTTPKDTP